MNNHRSIFALPGMALILIMLAGCGSQSPTSPASSADVMDLKVGNRWVYRTVSYDDKGNEYDPLLDTVSIVRTMNAAGVTWYVTSSGSMYANRPDGLWEWNADTASSSPTLYVPYPVQLNQSFNDGDYLTVDSTGDLGDTVHFSYVITSLSTQVTTHAGTFTCFQYSSRYRSSKGISATQKLGFDDDDVNSVAPGLGPVAGESYKLTSDGRRVLRMRWEMYQK